MLIAAAFSGQQVIFNYHCLFLAEILIVDAGYQAQLLQTICPLQGSAFPLLKHMVQPQRVGGDRFDGPEIKIFYHKSGAFIWV